MYKSFLIKYAEIAIKGKNRYLFEDALVQNIRYHLERVEGNFQVRKENGRIYVDTEGEYDYEETVETLQRIFGIVGITVSESVQWYLWRMKDLTPWQKWYATMWIAHIRTKILHLRWMRAVPERIIR